MPVRTGEKVILSGALDLLALHGFRAWRVNSGGLPTARGGFVRFGFPGCPDVWGLVPRTLARLIVVETKAPGKRPRPEQHEVLEAMRAAGAVAVWVDDLAVLDRVLRRLRDDPEARFHINGEKQP